MTHHTSICTHCQEPWETHTCVMAKIYEEQRAALGLPVVASEDYVLGHITGYADGIGTGKRWKRNECINELEEALTSSPYYEERIRALYKLLDEWKAKAKNDLRD